MSTTQVPAIDMNKLNAFIGQFVTDLGAAVHTGMVVIGEKLGLYKALSEADDFRRTCRQDEDGRTLSARVAGFASRRRLRHLRARRPIQPDQEQPSPWLTKTARPICPERLSWHWARWPRFRGLRNRSAPAPAWVGTSMLTASFTGAKNSFVPAMPPIS